MAGFHDLRVGLANAIADGTGLRAYADEPDTVSVPCLVVRPASPFAFYRQRFGRSTTTLYRFEVLAVVGRISESSGLQRLDELVSPAGPLITAINAYQPAPSSGMGSAALGLAIVTEGSLFGPVTVGAATYLGAQLTVEVTA